jgi:RND family efflux transporter MFP subunit
VPDDEPPPRRHRRRWGLVIAGAIVIVAFAAGIIMRLVERDDVRRDTERMSVPTVAVVRPERAAVTTSIVLPGNVQAYNDSPIFSRANGYVAKWFVDIGGRVKKDQLLAVLSVPELEHQLDQARHTLAVSEANLALAKQTATRFTELGGTRAVSEQEVDQAVSAQRANEASVNANVAQVRTLEASLDYAYIRAPFDGVITVRNVDVGDLINAGSSTVPRTELFHIVGAEKLRIYVSVPEAYARSTKPGLVTDITFIAVPGTFRGNLVRTAKAIDPTTRVLNIEIEVDNSKGTLFAGAFAQVRLAVPAAETWRVPVSALVFRKQGLELATVADGKIAMKRVTPGRDHGEWIEIAAGVTGDDLVVDNPSDSIADGQRVRAAPSDASAKR